MSTKANDWGPKMVVQRREPDHSGHYFCCQICFNLIAIVFICILILVILKERHDDEESHRFSAVEEKMRECELMYECDEMRMEKGKHRRYQQRHERMVCGSDGLFYDSSCELQVTACQFPEMKLVEADERSCENLNSITLIGGKRPSAGNIYARNGRNDKFGPVCDDGWSFYGANVVCNQLGYNGALKFTQESYFGQVTPSFSYNFIKCSGYENELDDCKHYMHNECTGYEAAGVVCKDDNAMPPTQGWPYPPGYPTYSSWAPPMINYTGSGNQTHQSCFLYDTDIVGNVFKIDSNVSDHLACQKICFNTQDCLFFSYNVYDQTCYEKNSAIQTVVAPTVISGPQVCH